MVRIRIHLKMTDKRMIRKCIVPEISIDRTRVYAALDCRNTSAAAVFEQYYDVVLKNVVALLKPEIIFLAPMDVTLKDGSKSVSVICELRSVGEAVRLYTEAAFKEGNSVQAMLASAMADEALFSMETSALEVLKEICRMLGCGIKRRLKLPEMISEESYKMAVGCMAAEKSDIKLTDGLMIVPEKSLCVMYERSEDMCLFEAVHRCEDCDNLNCARRMVFAPEKNEAQGKKHVFVPVKKEVSSVPKLKVHTDEGLEEILCQNKETVMSALSRLNPKYEAVCGGTGRCGKCRIKLEEGHLPVTEADRRCFTKKELLSGWRLACVAVVTENMTVCPKMADVSAMEVLTQTLSEKNTLATSLEKKVSVVHLHDDVLPEKAPAFYNIGIDIGTTTLAVGLYTDDGCCIDTYTALNRQRSFGADVISRIQSAVSDGARMRALVIEDISKGMEKLARKHLQGGGRIENIGIAANTTMLHLLLGYPCESLGCAPFLPYKKAGEQFAAENLFGKLNHPAFEKTTVLIYPGISAFVGADIVAGMTAVDMAVSEKVDLFVDLGTNGEMAIGNAKKLLVASTAAGPAFEGGNIMWGTGSVAGAICGAEFSDGRLILKTIGGAPPAGICGTGLIEVVCALRDAGVIDETGLLHEKYFDGGYPLARHSDGRTIVLTQKDIRELQMAKASICAGVQTLMEVYGVTEKYVNQVYIAGGFGYGLDYKKAARIGLLPKALEAKVQPVGNTALAGAALLAARPEILEKSEALVSRAKEISLADSKVFQKYYIQNLNF